MTQPVAVNGRHRRSSRSVAAVVLWATCAVLVAGCTSNADGKTDGNGRESVLDAAGLEELATQLALRSCTKSFKLLDDLQFWDSMRGSDCLPDEDPVHDSYVRVYAHVDSVEQVLTDWAPTIVGERRVARGKHWFVIGPQSVIDALRPPDGGSEVARDAGEPLATTAREEYRTMCIRALRDRALGMIAGELDQDEPDSLSLIFPGTIETVEDTLAPTIVDDLRLQGEESRTASLSAFGPRWKDACARAEERSEATTRDGDR